MKQTIEIEVPDGKKAVWKDGKVVFEDIKPQLPKTWEEFCKNYPTRETECYIDASCGLREIKKGIKRHVTCDRNLLLNEQAAEQHLALMQLHQLRDCYRQGWLPDWENDNQDKYSIIKSKDEYDIIQAYISRFFAFQDEKRAKEFLTNFRDLIEQAGDLI